jgi:ABC-type nitrate/sulfonate/bicarbonate transport system substrate-binding protein
MEFVQKYPNTARAMTAAVLEAGRWIDSGPPRARRPAKVIAQKSYVNTDEDVILGRFLGHYDNGNGRKWDDPNPMRLLQGRPGVVSLPVRWHVVHDAAPPLGVAQGRPGLSRGREEGEPRSRSTSRPPPW